MPQEQQTAEKQIRALREKLHAFLDDLRYMHKQYKDAPDLQVELSFLAHWFPNRIETFEQWDGKLGRAIKDLDYRKSEYFFAALDTYDSLGRALEADTRWSERDKSFHVKAGEMIDLSEEIRKTLREQQDSSE